jgi:cellulose synthase/poly-beta-1,6-N-acetylglucosamine synthase-like glycosyltransferase
MRLLFWLSLALVGYTYFGYPLLLWVLAKLWGRTPARAPITPKVTLLISAYNEQEVIAEKLQNSLALDYPREKLEILVASESTDQTNSIAASFAPQGVRLLSFLPRRGKSATLYAAVPQSTGEIIVFSDANCLYEPDALRKLVRNLADLRVGCVAGRFYYRDRNRPSSKVESLYRRYEAWVKRLESRLFSLAGADGPIFAVRKSLYLPLSETRGDDFELPVRVVLHGHGTIFEPEAVSLEYGPDSIGTEFRRRVRIISWMSISAILLAKEALARRKFLVVFQLISHKFLRWLALVFLAAALASSMALTAPFYRMLLALQLLFYLVALLAWRLESRLPRVLLFPYYICAIHLAALIGLSRSFSTAAGSAGYTWEKLR